MASIDYVSISNAIQDFIQDNDLTHEEIDETLLIKWATDAIRMCKTPQQLHHKVALLQVENSRAKLPDDFEMLGQAAANPDPYDPCDCLNDPDQDCCHRKTRYQKRPVKGRREDIVQWVQGTMEPDCEIEINLVCSKCKQTSCTCGNNNVVEVQVDRTWELSHPEYYYRHFDRIGRFGYGPGANSDYYGKSKFQLMRYASNDFHNLKNLIGECPNVDCRECTYEFILQLPYIEVDFQKGEVLVSYLGKVLDENGDYMIPNHPDVLAAVKWHLTHMWYWKRYSRTDNDRDLNRSELAERKRETAIGIAKSALEMPSSHEIRSYFENQTLKRVPNYHRRDRAGKLTMDEYEKYKRRLDEGV